MVPSWEMVLLVLNLALRAASLAASQRTLFVTVVPVAPGTAEVTLPFLSTIILTTTRPEACTEYSGSGSEPITDLPLKRAEGVPSVEPTRVLPWAGLP